VVGSIGRALFPAFITFVSSWIAYSEERRRFDGLVKKKKREIRLLMLHRVTRLVRASQRPRALIQVIRENVGTNLTGF